MAKVSKGPQFSEMPRAGYTIIEILAVLSIAGVIFASGFASFRDFSRRQLLSGSLRVLRGDLRLTQEYALIGKKPNDAKCTGLNLLNGYRFFVNSASQYIIRAYCTGGQVNIKTVDLPSDLTILTPSPNPITFKSLGQGTNLSVDAVVTLTQVSTGKTESVTVTKGGEIK